MSRQEMLAILWVRAEDAARRLGNPERHVDPYDVELVASALIADGIFRLAECQEEVANR